MVESTSTSSSKKTKGPSKFETLSALVDDEVKLKWENEQLALKAQLEEADRFDWVLDRANPANTTLKRVAAVDISYSRTNGQNAVAALIIFNFPSLKVVYEDFE